MENLPSLSLESHPTWVQLLVIGVSILLIAMGAHWVIDTAARLAKRLGISELVIGLTVVALGTSAPEFAVTLTAAFRQQGDISVGNVVGSNIFNLGFILGGCALVRAIPISGTLLRRDGAVLAGTTLLLMGLVGWDLRLGHGDGLVLALLLVLYLSCLFWWRHATDAERTAAVEEMRHEPSRSIPRDLMWLIAGLAVIVAGSHLLVDSASVVARNFGVSEWVIGVTIVAAGTSLPEFATSLAGVLRGRYGISAGNIIGSDIFNLLGVLGVAGLLQPVTVAPTARLSLAALCAMVFLVLIFMRTGWRISRLEGVLLVLFAAARWYFDFSTQSL